MKKSLITLIVAGSFALAGCSSGGPGHNDADPDWGVTPPAVQPPVDDNSPERPQADGTPDWGIDTAPDWGLDIGNTPDRVPPVWGGPGLPSIDNGPETAYTVSGNKITDNHGNVFEITDIDWFDQTMNVKDADGNNYYVSIHRQGNYEGDFAVTINGETIHIGRDAVRGGLQPLVETPSSTIDRDTVRDAIRSRLNK